jgi:hypothetical protein
MQEVLMMWFKNLGWIDVVSFLGGWGSSYFSEIYLHLVDYVCSLARIC